MNKEVMALFIHKRIWKPAGLVHYLIIVKLFENIILWKTFSKWKNCLTTSFFPSITLFERAWLLVYASSYENILLSHQIISKQEISKKKNELKMFIPEKSAAKRSTAFKTFTCKMPMSFISFREFCKHWGGEK